MSSSQPNAGLGIPPYDGLMCVGGPITKRFPVQFTGPTGLMDPINPAASTLVLITPGSTWNFTTWFRDAAGSPCGKNANLSNALQVNFLP